MSSSHSNSKHSPPSPDSPNTSDPAALAAALQQTAETLLVFQAKHAPKEPEEPALRPPSRGDEGEIRSYYFPPATVHLEKELLRKYRASDFQGLLEEAHALLVGLTRLMQSVHKDVRVRGYVISSLGKQLEHASALLLRMRNVYDRVAPVQR